MEFVDAGHRKEMINGYSDMDCNKTCCSFVTAGGILTVFCFFDHNFPKNITTPLPWELGIRWSFAILVTLMALIGNMSLIFILAKNKLLLKTSINSFILNMSVADLVLAVAGPIPFTIRDTNELWVLGQTWCYLEGYIQILVMLVSVTSLTVISCDRMIGVVYPFHKHLKKWLSTTIIVLIWVASAIVSVPFALYRVYTVHEWQDLTERTCEEISYKIHCWWIIVTVALTWLPLLVMVTSYIVIFIKLENYNSVMRGREHPAILHMKKRVVRMMFVVVVVFIVCWMPFQIFQLIQDSISDDDDRTQDTSQMYGNFLSVSQYMIYVNGAVNPIIYGLMHQTFRKAFRVTFSCFFRQKSHFILTRRDGSRGFVWSLKSTARPMSRSGCNNRVTNRLQSHSVEQQDMEAGTSNNFGNWPINHRDEFSLNDRRIKTLPLTNSALGHLIKEVIEEETTSDLDSKRII